MRLRTTTAELPISEHLLIVSARVVEGAQRMVRQVYEELPGPKLVIRSGVCLSTSRFWDVLPGGWVATDEVLPIDIQIDDCVAGSPEALLVAFMTHPSARTASKPAAPERVMSIS
jgi:NADH-quinone oxidoreductase subunit B